MNQLFHTVSESTEVQKTIFLPAISTAVINHTHTIAPHLALDLYLVSGSACLHLQGASKLKVQVAEGIFPEGMTQGADRQALTSSAGVTQPTDAGASAS